MGLSIRYVPCVTIVVPRHEGIQRIGLAYYIRSEKAYQWHCRLLTVAWRTCVAAYILEGFAIEFANSRFAASGIFIADSTMGIDTGRRTHVNDHQPTTEDVHSVQHNKVQ